MASILKRVVANRNRASALGFCSRCPLKSFNCHVQHLAKSLSPSVVALASFFSDNSCGGGGGGTGFFLDPTLIVTSAHVVGRVSTVYQSRTLEKPGRFEHGSVLYKSYIGSTAAQITKHAKMLKTRPLAVNFAKDVAVLEVVNPEGISLPHCTLANSLPDEESILMAIAHEQCSQFDVYLGNVRALRRKTVRAEAPWPRNDELGWVEHEWFFYGGGGPPPGSVLYNSGEKVTGSVTRTTGSPWFNVSGEVVGISSWEVRDDPAKFSVGYGVPSPCIRSVLDYAKAKKADDPIVMDHWIEAHVIPRGC